MIKMPKLGGHVFRMADFFEQMTSMLGFTENIVGAWQLVRKTGRLHVKVPFLIENQNQLSKNYFAIICDTCYTELIQYLTGEKPDPTCTNQDDKKKVRFAQNYSLQQITDVWKRFLNVISGQLTESFEIERQKGLNTENQKTLAPHQHIESAQANEKRKQERQSEENNMPNTVVREEELHEDPF